MNIPKEILNRIADELESGFKVFVHKKTLELVVFPDELRYPDMDESIWQEEIDKISSDATMYIEIEGMNSSESFRIIEDFVNSLPNNSAKVRLLQAIVGRKPFGNFKHQIENSDYREKWFAFRRERNIEWVKDQIKEKI